MARRRGIAVQCNIRIAVELRDHVRKEAKQHGRSFSEEVAQRLGRTAMEDNAFGGEAGRYMATALTTAFVRAGTSAADGRETNLWITEPKAYDAAMRAVTRALVSAHPGISPETLLIADSFKNNLASQIVNRPRKQTSQKSGRAA